MCEIRSAYRSSGNTGEVFVEIMVCGTQRSCALSEDSNLLCLCDTRNKGTTRSYLARISTKRRDVTLHPLESSPLVTKAEIEDTFLYSLGSLGKAQRSEAVVDRYVQDWCPL